MNNNYCNFSLSRLWAVMLKEFILVYRDRLTFFMVVAIPIIQVILFGYAINNNPHDLPTAVITADHSIFTRTFIQGLKNTKYFSVVEEIEDEKESQKLIAKNQVQFVITIPANFTKDIIRNDPLHPAEILVDADATDSIASLSALNAIKSMMPMVFLPLFTGKLNYLNIKPFPIQIVTHANYNPESITEYNIVPGLLGVVLTMTMVMITCMSIIKEYEIGTMENLLATPAKPLEIFIGKILPYVIMGYLQTAIILLLAICLFHVPFFGNFMLLFFATLLFICANLAIGMSFSSLAKNQLQALQMTFFFFLPSIMLSGFMFPFRGMPIWAQYIGNTLPLTHYLRIVRGIMLKGNSWQQIWPDIWPMLLFTTIAIFLGVKVYRKTLD